MRGMPGGARTRLSNETKVVVSSPTTPAIAENTSDSDSPKSKSLSGSRRGSNVFEASDCQSAGNGTVMISVSKAFALSCMSRCLSAGGDKECKVVVGGEKCLAIIDAVIEPSKKLPTLTVVKNLGGRNKLHVKVTDCKWHPNRADQIATASAAGFIVIWDVTSGSRKVLKRTEGAGCEHTRLVNRVAWHPTEESLILSASQDSTVKLWDLRTFSDRPPVTFRVPGPEGQSPQVRDIEFDPFDGSRFACSTDESAEVLLWDIRMQERGPLRRLSASIGTSDTGAVVSLNWHPVRRGWLATGSKDKTVRVWDLHVQELENLSSPISTVDYGKATINTVTCVGRVCWRPPPSPFHDSHQIAEVSFSPLPVINIWDYRKPLLPVCCIQHPHNTVTDLEWWGGEMLFSTSKAGTFAASLIECAHVPIAHLCSTAVTWGPQDMLVYHNDAVDFPSAGRRRGILKVPDRDDMLSPSTHAPTSRASPATSYSTPMRPNIPPSPISPPAPPPIPPLPPDPPPKKQGLFGKLFGSKTKPAPPPPPEPAHTASPPSPVPLVSQTFDSFPSPPSDEPQGRFVVMQSTSDMGDKFAHLAAAYELEGKSPIDLCYANAAIAEQGGGGWKGDGQLASCWRVLAALVEQEPQKPAFPDHDFIPSVSITDPTPTKPKVHEPVAQPTGYHHDANDEEGEEGEDGKRAEKTETEDCVQEKCTASPPLRPETGKVVPAIALNQLDLTEADVLDGAQEMLSGTEENEAQTQTGSTRCHSAVNIEVASSWGSQPNPIANSNHGVLLGKCLDHSVSSSSDDSVPSDCESIESPEMMICGVSSKDEVAYFDPSPVFEAMIEELLEVGDVQTVCTMIIVVRGLSWVFHPEPNGQRGEEWFMSYYDMLVSRNTNCKAALVLKLCPFSKVARIGAQGTDLLCRCSVCKDTFTLPMWRQKVAHQQLLSDRVVRNCCYRARLCSICGKEVLGLYLWSRVCGHGGHFSCMRTWLSTSGLNRYCPECGRETARHG